MRKNKRARACAISAKVREEVHHRDGDFCVFCGRYLRQTELAHVIGRSQGGLGVPENLVTLGSAFECDCHYIFDNGTREQRQAMKNHFSQYLKEFYPHWNEYNLTYKKWG